MANTTRTTVVGIFKNINAAEEVANDLVAAGIPRTDVQIGSQSNWTSNVASGGAGLTGQAPEHRHGGFWGWFEGLFGHNTSEKEQKRYSEAIRRGNCVVAVDTDDSNRDRVVDIMEDHGALDIDKEKYDERTSGLRDERASGLPDEYTSGLTGESTPGAAVPGAGNYRTSGTAGSAGMEEGTTRSIPVVEEELQVGKRAVQRGGVRIYTHTVEEPVEEQVNLREEKVRVERRPADRPVSPGDVDQMRDQTIEVTEMAEEPVVNKRARVVEEVIVGKDATERTETVRDTVRNQKVEVEQLTPGGGAAGRTPSTYESDFRSDFDTNYARSGSKYELYAPAYAYGARMADDARYRGKRFEDVEETLKTDYLRNNPNSSWDRMRGAVRYGWERATHKR